MSQHWEGEPGGSPIVLVRSDNLLELWAGWLSAAGMSAATIDIRRCAVVSLASHAGRRAELAGPMEVVAWMATLANPWTRSTYYAGIRQWFGWLVDMDVREDNPMAKVPKPKRPKGVPRPVPSSVIAQMLAEPLSYKSLAYVTLAAFAGLRVHEIAKIRGEDVDRDGKTLFVRGKGGTEALVPMHPRLENLARGKPRTGWWFPTNSATGHVQPDSVSRTLVSALRAAGSEAKPHALRHAYGTTLLAGGANLRVVQQAMRHQSISSTEVYTQVLDQDVASAVRGIRWPAA